MIRKTLYLILCSIALLGCSNHLLNETTEYKGKAGTGIVTVSIGEEDFSSRTVLPINSNSDLQDFVEITLKGKINGTTGSPEQKASWTDYDALKTDGTKIELDTGNWDLTLTAKRYGTEFTQTLSNIAVVDGKTTRLEFNKMSSVSLTDNTGKVEVTFIFPTDLNIARYTAKLGDAEETELTEMGSSANRRTFIQEKIKSGTHWLTFYGYNAAGEKVFTYPTSVIVEGGYKSSATLTTTSTEVVQSNKQSFSVTYKINETDNTTSDYQQTYYSGSHILAPSTLGFSVTGKVLKNWNTKADGNGIAYQPGTTPVLNSNTTLYAIWWPEGSFVVTYIYNISDTDNTTYTKEVTSGSDTNHPTNTEAQFKWDGKTFLGWDTNRNGNGTRYNANTKIDLTENTVLYAQWVTGAGSNEYTVSTNKEWNAVFNSTSASTAKIILGANITAPDTSKTKVLDFAGTFDGGSYTISGLSTNMFKSVTSNGTVKNLNLSGDILGNTAATGQGMVANTNAGTITDVTVSGSLSNSYGNDIGGVVGKNTGTVTRCTSSISISGEYDVGGVIGENRGTCSYNNFSGTADGTGTGSNVGGIVGYNYYGGSEYGKVEYCMAWGTVKASSSISDTNVGCIIGEAYAAATKTTNVSYCAATGTITGGKYQGGLIGYNHQSRASYCYTKGVEFKDVSSVGSSSGTGGLYGYEYGGDSSTGWEESHSYCTDRTTTTLFECVGAPTARSGTLFKYNDGVAISDINKGGTKWYTNTGVNGVSTKLPYEVRRP